MKGLRDSRGLILIEYCFIAYALSLITAAVIVRPNFIVKKSIEKCVSDGGERVACKDQVNAMTQDQRIEYIRDKATGPATQNFGG